MPLIDNTRGLYPRITWIKYPKVGQMNSACRVGVVEVDSGRVTFMQVPGDPRQRYIARMDWAGDSGQLVLQQLNRLQNTNRVMLANAATGKVQTILTERDAAWVDVHDELRWLADGQQFTWISERDGWRHVYRASREAPAEPQLITPGDYDVLVKTALTDAAGTYGFTVQAGSYFVEVLAPPGYLFTSLDQGGDDTVDSDISPLTSRGVVTSLAIGENDPTWDAGLVRPVAIGDRVWLDVDGDGIEDVGEPGIANVTLDLFDAGANGVPGGGDDVKVGSLVTDHQGYYLFPDRLPDSYFVDVVDATVPSGLALSGGTDPSTGSTLLSGQTVLTKDFGYTDDGDAVIGDYVWSDADNDGIQDPGEVGIGGVTLELLDAGADGVFGTADDGVVASTTTAADGSYLFTGVAAGEYVVDVTDTAGVLAGYALTSGPQSSTDFTAPITVAAGDVYLAADFGYFQAGLGTIGTHVWADADDDGFFDAGESGIAGVTLALVQDTNADGVWDPDGADDVPGNADDEPILGGTATDAGGGYLFSGLSLDDGGGDFDFDYLVVVTDTADALNGLALTTGAMAGDGFSKPDPYAVALSAGGGETNVVADFGYNRPGTIGDRVWSDADGDGLQDPGEAGIGGVTLELRDAGSGALLATTTTAADGSYLFTLLVPGSYRVVVTDTGGVLAGYTQTGDPDEAGTCAVCDGEGSSTLAAGESDLTRDFGYRNAALANISGTVFYDADIDGFHDEPPPPETGFAGVTMELWHDVDGNGLLDPAIDERLATTVTDAVGDYLFADLPDDDYIVAVSDQAGVLDGYRLTSGRDQIPVELMGVDVVDVDFGYVRDGITGSIGDTVWLDTDGDGLPGPTEPRLPGVALSLYADADRDGVFEPDVTVIDGRIDLDADGDVDGFDDGELGSVGIVDGYVDLDGDGLANETNGDDDGSWNGVTVDDGLIDLDGDGTAGETNGNDTGTLTGDDGAPLATTVTGADGRYLFDRLAAGSYFVDLDETTLPDSTADGVPDLVETSYPGVDPAAAIALSEGEQYRDADFGYRPRTGTAAIGDRVWHDADADGLQDPGEAGISGVDIVVSGPSGDVTVTTGFNGIYMVTGLSAATATDYSVNYVAATVPVGMTQTYPSDLTWGVTVNDGDLFLHLDYGFTDGTTGSIGNKVWLDVDGDGDRDAGEAGLEGVTVNLIRDTNADGAWQPAGADGLFGTADDEVVVASTVTDAAGDYLFTGLSLSDAGDGDAGDADYLVDVTDIDGVLAGLQKTSGAAQMDDNSQADPYAVQLTALAPDDVTADFGYTAAGGYGSIGNLLFRDPNGNGVREAGEAGIEGVEVALWLDVDGNGAVTAGVDNLLRTTRTDVNGEYLFNGLPFGSYVVDVTDANFEPGPAPPPGVLSGLGKTSGTAGLDDNSQADPYAVTLTSASPENLTADFGYEAPPATSYTISGTVFEDEDRDAVFDDGLETEVPTATLLLYRDLDLDGVIGPDDPIIDRTTSDVVGDYLFTDLPAGSYIVAVDNSGTIVDGYIQTTQTGTGGVEPVVLPNPSDPLDPPNSTGHDFGFWNGGVTTTPVTLAWFRAEVLGGGVRLAWVTATEVANVGFNVYAVGERGLERLNDELIRSKVVDSLEPQSYSFDAWGSEADQFVLEDVDLLGVRRYHGPFARGAEAGSLPAPEPIDWQRVRASRARQKAARRGAAARGPARARGWPAARLLVTESGIHRVRYEELLAAGVDLAGAPLRELALVSGGQPVAVRVEGRGRFGPGAFVEFVGEALDTLYTRTNVYTLAVDAALARRVGHERRPAPPWADAPVSYQERLVVERDRGYILTSPAADPWYDELVLAYGGPAAKSFEVVADAVAGGGARLEAELWGLSSWPRSPDHHVRLAWNGSEVAAERFDGQVVQTVTVELAAGTLVEGANQLEVALPGDTGALWDMVAFDRLTLVYERRFLARQGRLRFAVTGEALEVSGLDGGDAVVYRLTDGEPVLLDKLQWVDSAAGPVARFAGTPTETVYEVASASALLTPAIEPAPAAEELLTGEARLLIVAHPDFTAGIEPLAAARRAEGWSVRVASSDAVYAAYSHGRFDPSAIRAFIRDAHARLGTEAVLLVGGDSYDYHDNLGLGSVSFIPSLYLATDEVVRHAPVDPLYGDVDGDLVPDVAVGRLPVRTPDELAAVVERTLEYGEVVYGGTALLAADAYDVAAGYSFTAASEDLAARLPADWALERAYMDELGLAGARQRLLDGVEAGVGLTSFFGHSGPTVWSFRGLFSAADAAALDNAGRPTVVTQWGCWNTYHVTPRYNTLGHKLLLSGDRGAAAVLGAATLTEAPSERKLGRLLFARLGRDGTPIGRALVDAQRQLAASEPHLLDVILGWTLLGDPTLVPAR